MSFHLIIQPHDILLFRDGKPFSAGVDVRARSLFPPTPFTIQGAIRARVLFSSPTVSLAEYYNQTTPEAKNLLNLISSLEKGYGQLKLRGPFLARKENDRWIRYFPLPADVVRRGGAYELLNPLSKARWQSNLPEPLHPLWIRSHDRPEEARGWISEKELMNYLEGKAPQEVLEESQFVERESRFGIAIERKGRTVRESHLYLAEFLRLKENVAFWVVVEGIEMTRLGGESGFLQLGGEARAAYYEVMKDKLDVPPSPPKQLPKRFKVVLLTPAWFTGGWRPQNGDWIQFFGRPVQLISAMLPRYQAIGGVYVSHQQQKGLQRPIQRFVPAGSVYFFECKEQTSWQGKPFTEKPQNEGDYGQIGFGTCVITKTEWNYMHQRKCLCLIKRV